MTAVRLPHPEQPLDVLHRCKVAAIRDGWLLERWEEFSKTARACLSPECEPEEMEKFLTVVAERFEIEPTKEQ